MGLKNERKGRDGMEIGMEMRTGPKNGDGKMEMKPRMRTGPGNRARWQGVISGPCPPLQHANEIH